MRSLDVLFTPAEFAALAGRDLSATTCVVFDVLRATSTMLQALANGATAIYPVNDIAEALAWRARSPDILLAGERNGLRIRAAQTGGTDFGLGNSPREFTPERVAGNEIAMTTTNGTLALRACAGARHVLVASFANLGATADWLRQNVSDHVLFVCAGTGAQAAYEDTLGAGALADRIWPVAEKGEIGDAAQIARQLFRTSRDNLTSVIQHASNGRRLLGIPELADDVSLCLAPDRFDFIARMGSDGAVRRG